MNVSSNAGFPVGGATGALTTPFVVQINNEQMQVISAVGTTWTVNRGFNGTTAAAQANGSDITSLTWTVVRGVNGTSAAPVAGGATVKSLGGLATTTATAAIAVGATTMNVASNFNFPVAGLPGTPFVVQVDNEQVQVTAAAATTINQAGGVTAGANTITVTSDAGFPPTPFNVQVGAEQMNVTGIGATSVNQVGGISAAATTMTVASSAGFPATPFVVQIGAEQINVTGVAGTTWTIVRGFNGTTPAAQANGATIQSLTWSVTRGVNGSVAAAQPSGAGVQSLTWSIVRGVNGTAAAAHANGALILSTTMNVASSTSFPPVPFTIQVGGEQMQVTNVAGTTWTLVRGINGTAAGAQPDGSNVASLTWTVTRGFNGTTIAAHADGAQVESPGGLAVSGTTTTGALTSIATTMTVASNANFPTTNVPFTPFVVQIDNEQILVTGVSGLTWTITRGVFGTAPAPHASGAAVLNTTMTVASSAGIPPTPFVVQIGTEQVEVTNVATTTINQIGGLAGTTTSSAATAGATSITVNSDANFPIEGLPGTPFVVQVDNEQMKVTSVGQTTIDMPFNGLTSTTTAAAVATTDTTLTVASTANLPTTFPFVVQVDNEQVQATSFLSTSINEAGGIGIGATSVTVASTAGFPPVPFAVSLGGTENVNVTAIQSTTINQVGGILPTDTVMTVNSAANIPATPFNIVVGAEQMQVTSAATTTLNGGITAAATSMTVTSSAGFPPIPFVIQVNAEKMQVTNVVGTTWTIVRGFAGTVAAVQANGSAVASLTWSITRGINGTTATGHLSGAVVLEPVWTISATTSAFINGTSVTALDTYSVNRGVNGTFVAAHANGAMVLNTTLTVASNANFPTSVPFNIQVGSQVAPEEMQVTNIASTTLNGGITAAATTLTVMSSAGFPPTPFVVQIGGEQMQVTNVAGTTWTVSRGFNGTPVTAQSSGATVTSLSWTVQRAINGTTALATQVNGAVVDSLTWTVQRGVNGTVAAPHLLGTNVLNTTVNVASSAGFPVVPFVVQICNEQMEVTNVSGNTWTLVRGFNGTTAASYPTGTTIVSLSWTVLRGFNETTPAPHVNGANVLETTWTVVRGFNSTPAAVEPVGSDVFGLTWSVTRGVNGTTVTPHATGAAVLNTVMNVSTNLGFPVSNLPSTPFNVQVGSEQMQVTGVSTTTLNETNGAGANDTTLTVSSNAGFPATPYLVYIGGEQVLVTNVPATNINQAGGLNASDTSLTVSSSAGFVPVPFTPVPFSPFVVTIGNEQLQVTGIVNTTVDQSGGLSAAGTTLTVASTAGFPPTPFVIQVGNEQMLVTNVSTTNINMPSKGLTSTTLAAPVLATDTTITVASNANFPVSQLPFTPFVVQVDSEQMLVTSATGTTWTVSRGYNSTAVATHSVGAAVLNTTLTVSSNVGFPPVPFVVTVGNEQMEVTNIPTTTIDMPPAGLTATTTTANMVAADTTMTVASNANFPVVGLPVTPFVVQVDNEQIEVVGAEATTIDQVGGITAAATSMTVTSSAGVPPAPFIVQVGAEQMQVTTVASTTIDQAGGMLATDTTMNVASSLGVPATPFIVMVGSEQMQVTGVAGNTWTVVRGLNGTDPVAHANTTSIVEPVWTVTRGFNGTIAAAASRQRRRRQPDLERRARRQWDDPGVTRVRRGGFEHDAHGVDQCQFPAHAVRRSGRQRADAGRERSDHDDRHAGRAHEQHAQRGHRRRGWHDDRRLERQLPDRGGAGHHAVLRPDRQRTDPGDQRPADLDLPGQRHRLHGHDNGRGVERGLPGRAVHHSDRQRADACDRCRRQQLDDRPRRQRHRGGGARLWLEYHEPHLEHRSGTKRHGRRGARQWRCRAQHDADGQRQRGLPAHALCRPGRQRANAGDERRDGHDQSGRGHQLRGRLYDGELERWRAAGSVRRSGGQ